MGRDEGSAQDVVVEVPQDFLSIPGAQKREQSKNIKKKKKGLKKSAGKKAGLGPNQGYLADTQGGH